MADLKLIADSGGGTVSLKAPAATTSNAAVTLKLPVADGSANQLLKTDGSGQLGWATDSATDSTKMPLAGGTFTGDTLYNDSVKAKFGTSSDLQIYHNGTNSKIENATGGLYIDGATNGSIYLRPDNGQSGIDLIQEGAVNIYYDNVKKFETTSTGVKIHGTLVPMDTSRDLGSSSLPWQDLHIGNDVYLADNAELRIGSGNDLKIYHDGSNSYIKNITAGLFIQGGTQNNSIYIRPRDGENSIQANSNGSVDLYYDNVKVFETASNGAKVLNPSGNGTLSIIGSEGNDAILQLKADDGDDAADHWRIVGDADGSLYIQNWTASAWETNIKGTGNGNVELYYNNTKRFETNNSGAHCTGSLTADTVAVQDNEKFLAGNDDDLEIYHDGSHSIIKDSGTGNLRVITNNLRVENAAGTENQALFTENGSVELYYDNSKKLETDSFGVSIQGDCLKVPDGSAGSPGFTFNNEGNADTGIFRPGANELGFSTAGTERLRIGTAAIDVSSYFNVTNAGLAAQIYHSGSGDNNGCVMRHGRGGLSGYAGKMISFRGNDNTEEGSIVIGTTATAYNTSSDYRLKENQVAISDGITRLKTLKPYRFNFKKDPDVTVDGFFAHEVTAVPEAITGEKDKVITQSQVDDGSREEADLGKPEYQQIDQSKLVPLLTAALQEAIGKIEVLETKIAALGG